MKRNYVMIGYLAPIVIGIIVFFIPKKHTFESLINNYKNTSTLSGVILVAHEHTILYQKVFGLANKEKDIKNNIHSEFLIASITKQFTAAAILLLVQKGLIQLNHPVSEYLSASHPIWDKKMPTWADTITIHHLLSHSSGLAEYVSLPGFDAFYDKPHTSKELIQFFSDQTVRFSPGNKYEYSGSGYNLLGAIIESVSGKSYGEFLKANFFDPLNLTNIYASHTQLLSDIQKDHPNISIGYNYNPRNNQIEKAGLVNLSTAFSEASIISNVNDLYRWLYALYSGQLISETMLKKMTTPYFTIEDDLGVGYGIYSDPNKGNPVYVHTGIINGYEGIALYSPLKKIYVIILSNLQGSNIFSLGYSLIDLAVQKHL
jgi:CubicO group peptidase (beta-lactamase class C family)